MLCSSFYAESPYVYLRFTQTLHYWLHVTGLAATSAKQQTMLDDLHSMSSRDQAALEQVQHTSARGQAHVQGNASVHGTVGVSHS